MTEEDQLARDITNAVEEMNKRPHLKAVQVDDPKLPVAKATNENTGRASANMIDQMQKVIETIERDIAEADEVRLTVTRRINDLRRALAASKAAVEMLKT